MRSHSGVAGRMFEILAATSINIEMISTSEIKISGGGGGGAPRGGGGLYSVLLLDVILIVTAAVLAFGPWVERPLSLYLAAAAVLAGGVLACGAIAYQAAPHRPPSGVNKPSRVRVRLTRLLNPRPLPACRADFPVGSFPGPFPAG